MSNKLENLLMAFMGVTANSPFLDLVVRSNGSSARAEDIVLGTQLAKIFLLSDISLYASIVILIVILGINYRRCSMQGLTKKLQYSGLFFVYVSLIINLFGLAQGDNSLSALTLSLFEGAYSFTLFTQLSKLFLLLIAGSVYILFPAVYDSKMRSMELPILIQISLALCATLISSTNFVLLLLALEGFSLVLYIMTALGRTYGGITAAAKYFAFGTLGSIFLFWGAVHIYAVIPSLAFHVVNAALEQSNFMSSGFASALEFATTAFALGFMLKLGAAPLHQWVADVYAGSHMLITAFFSIFVKFVLFIIFINAAVHSNCDYLLKMFVLFSLVVGCAMSLRQVEIKRLLAYSSVVHVAFLLMGDFVSSITYLSTYLISALLLFSVLLTVELAGKEIIYLNDLRLARNSSYLQVLSLTLALASSAGLPPFVGFYGKFTVWSSLIEDLYLSNDTYSHLTLLLSIVVSLLTIYYYMRILAYLFVGGDEYLRAPHLVTWDLSGELNATAYLQCILCVLVVLWTLAQPWTLGIVQHIALSC